MSIRQILSETDTRLYRPAGVRGVEPVRDYRRTAALLRSRLNAAGAGEADFLAEPRFTTDHTVEWITDRFDSVPRALSEMRGEERDRYLRILGSLRGRLLKGAAEADAETRPLLECVTSIPGEDCIFCADDRIVITQWGMKPTGAGNCAGISLLSYTPEPQAAMPAAAPPRHRATPAAVPPAVPPSSATSAAAPPPATPAPSVASVAGQGQEPRRKRSFKWLWWLLGALLLVALLWLLTRSCTGSAHGENTRNIEKVAPPVSGDKIIPAPDSLSYVAGDRMNIYVLKGGDLDDFISKFRKEWGDTKKYQLVNPDTTLRRVILICPEGEREKLMEEVPRRMAPGLEVIALPENIYQSNARTDDPAMSDPAKSYYFDMTGAIEAWDREMGSKDVTVAVLDGGFDLTHPEIRDKIVKPYDAITHTSRVPNVAACGGHATHVSATAAGTAGNRQGAAGIAPGCRIMPVNVFTADGQSYDSAIIDGIMYAVSQGADVINMSLGAHWGPLMKLIPPEELERVGGSRQIREAEIWDKVFDYAESRGVTVVKAAGNDNIPAVMDPMNRSEHALVVAAVDPSGRKAIFDPFTRDGSNYGPLCRISAPGVEIYNAMSGGGYASLPGTSMAAPQVAGGAALLKSRHPDWTPDVIRKVLIGTGRKARSAGIGPVMYLAAALDADPGHLPEQGTVPDYSGGFGSPDGLPGFGEGFGPLPLPGGGSGFEIIIGNPGNGGDGSGSGDDGTRRAIDDCDKVRRRYDDLRRRKAEIERELKSLKEECPDCV